jgi:hypothetical protein
MNFLGYLIMNLKINYWNLNDDDGDDDDDGDVVLLLGFFLFLITDAFHYHRNLSYHNYHCY